MLEWLPLIFLAVVTSLENSCEGDLIYPEDTGFYDPGYDDTGDTDVWDTDPFGDTDVSLDTDPVVDTDVSLDTDPAPDTDAPAP